MTLRTEGEFAHGDNHQDLRSELSRFSEGNEYPIDSFADVRCDCGCDEFRLLTDEAAGVAIRHCTGCDQDYLMGDSAEYLEDAELGQHECLCDADVFQITAGVHRYREQDGTLSNDVRWLYIGCRCVACGMLGCYADWKSEFTGYEDLLARM